jgi:hypothetical protein
MKTVLKLIVICHVLSAVSFSAFGQGTAFTYQGRLNSGGNPANGNYDFRFRVASDPFANNYVGSSFITNGVPVAGGLFVVTLDFGTGIFTGSNYWLEVNVRTNGAGSYTVLNPLQPLTPTPYAQFAATSSNLSGTLPATQLSGAVPSANLSGTYSGAVTFNNASGNFSGNGGGLTNVNAAAFGGLGANQIWKTTGNSNTVAGANFLGTADNQPLELRVNGTRALRMEPNTNGAPNMIGGAPVNYVDPGIVGATIAGGGTVTGNFYLGAGSNRVAAIFGTIGGGRMNTIYADHAFIGGGIQNTIQPEGYDGVIGGGVQNTIQTNAYDSVIGGGVINAIQNDAFDSVIGGGGVNTIQTNAYLSTIGGGYYNVVQSNASYSAIGGGYLNSAGGQYAVVSGGAQNSDGGNYSTIGGGVGNMVQNGSVDAFIGGGYFNTIQGGTHESVIVGGATHTIASNIYNGFIGGGWNNFIGGYYSAVVGGLFNYNAGRSSVISGGENNFVVGDVACIPGGNYNVAAGRYSFAAGNQAQANHDGTFVWSDSQNAPFASNVSNQFSVRATGGIRFVTGGSGMTLDGPFQGIGSALTSLNAANISSGTLADARLSPNVALRTGGNTFADLQRIAGPDGNQLILQNSSDGNNWYLYDEHLFNSGNLIFQPNSGIGGYISRVDGNYHINSDLRLKRDITALDGVLDRLLQLRPVFYHFRSAPEGAPLTLGLIAQEVEPLFPEVVGERDGIKSMAYSELVPVTISAIQELNRKVELDNTELHNELKRRGDENAELKLRLEALEKIVRSQSSN